MESHEYLIVPRSGPTRVNLPEISTKQLVETCAAANMLVFLRTLYGYLLRGIDSHSSPDAFLPTLYRALVFLLRCCGDVRCAIRGFCEGGFSRACDRNLRARDVGVTEGRFGFRPRGFRESCAARTEESGGAQLSGLGLARGGRDRFRDRSLPVCGETESRFCAGPHEFLQRASAQRRRACCAPGGQGGGAASPSRFRDASHFGACTRFFRGSRRRNRRVPAGDRA